MEAVVVGLFTSVTAGLGLTLWYLLVHPSLMLSLFDDDAPLTDDGFFEDNPAMLSALRWVVGLLFVASAFATGAATAFMAKTAI